jgi:hypothetical protein
MEEQEEELYLIYVDKLGKDAEGLIEYNLYFSDKLKDGYTEDMHTVCGLCKMKPPKNFKQKFTIKTDILLTCIQESMCMNMQNCVDHCTAIAFQNIDFLEEYPQNGRLVLDYGHSCEDIFNNLADIHGFEIVNS